MSVSATGVPAGLLTRHARRGGSAGTVSIDLDVRHHPFLQDHLVGGRALLSTVMGIEGMACAVALAMPGWPVSALTDLRIGPPYFLPNDGAGTARCSGSVEVNVAEVNVAPADGGTRRVRSELAGRDSASEPSGLHYSACFARRQMRSRNGFRTIPRVGPGNTVVDAETVYGLFFHGPSFQVVAGAYYADGLMIGVLQPDLPPATRRRQPSIMAPLLVELCLQTAGLWALAVLGRMVIPDGIDSIARFTEIDVHDGVPLFALVSPRRGHDGEVHFDAQVVDPGGSVHVEVRGYRTTDFGHPIDHAAAASIQLALSGIPALL